MITEMEKNEKLKKYPQLKSHCQYIYLSVCFLLAHKSHKTTHPHFTKFSVHVTSSSNSSSIHCVLSVLWMTSGCHVIKHMGQIKDDTYVSSSFCQVMVPVKCPTTFFRRVRQAAAPGAKSAISAWILLLLYSHFRFLPVSVFLRSFLCVLLLQCTEGHVCKWTTFHQYTGTDEERRLHETADTLRGSSQVTASTKPTSTFVWAWLPLSHLSMFSSLLHVLLLLLLNFQILFH